MTTETNDLEQALTEARKTAAAIAAAEELLPAVERVVKELNSGYGNTLSSVSPYKQILGPELDVAFFDEDKNGIFAKIIISANQQSPYGDNATTSRNFVISRDDVHTLAANGPHEYRGTFNRFAAKLDKKYAEHELEIATRREQERIAGIRDTVKQMGQLNAPVTAPPRARFPNRK